MEPFFQLFFYRAALSLSPAPSGPVPPARSEMFAEVAAGFGVGTQPPDRWLNHGGRAGRSRPDAAMRDTGRERGSGITADDQPHAHKQ
jgi:hypothetical protein